MNYLKKIALSAALLLSLIAINEPAYVGSSNLFILTAVLASFCLYFGLPDGQVRKVELTDLPESREKSERSK